MKGTRESNRQHRNSKRNEQPVRKEGSKRHTRGITSNRWFSNYRDIFTNSKESPTASTPDPLA